MSGNAPHLTDDQIAASLYLTAQHIDKAKKTKSHKVIVDEVYLIGVKLCLESVLDKKYSEAVERWVKGE